MDRVRNYYVAHSQDANLKDAFIWGEQTVPSGGKILSVAFLLALSALAIDMGVALAAIVYADLAFGWHITNSIAFTGIALVYGVLQLLAYFLAVGDWPRLR